MKKNNLAGSLLLLLTAVIWGAAFVAQSEAMDSVGALTFNCVRFLIGAASLVPAMLIMKNGQKKRNTYVKPSHNGQKTLIKGGLLCGLALGLASCFQQYAIVYTTVSKAGFITALYILMVPIISIFFGHRPSPVLWLSVIIAVVGLYFLCITDGFSIARGDLLALICSALFSVQIMLVDRFSPYCDSVKLSCIQFITAAVIAGIGMFFTESPTLSGLWQARWAILYTGVMSSGVAYTLQIAGQKRTNPVLASLLMSLESVFATLFGALLLHEIPTSREYLGCALVFTAIILAQLFPSERKNVIN